jgi:hypothetical protein
MNKIGYSTRSDGWILMFPDTDDAPPSFLKQPIDLSVALPIRSNLV